MSKLILALYVLSGSLALIALKYGTKTGLPVSYADSKLHFNLNYDSIIGIVLYGLSFILYIYLISKFDLGYIIPLAAAFVYILIFIASAIVFNEVFTVIKIVGISLILIGIILLSLKK